MTSSTTPPDPGDLRALCSAAGLELTDHDLLALSQSLKRHRATMAVLRAADSDAVIPLSGDERASL